jgi:Flp pilus assembly pilin Flp
MIRRIVAKFFIDDRGQDIAEYCLMTALVALVALGIFIHAAGGIQAIWSNANSTIAVNTNNGAGTAGGSGNSADQR